MSANTKIHEDHELYLETINRGCSYHGMGLVGEVSSRVHWQREAGGHVGDEGKDERSEQPGPSLLYARSA